MCRGKFPNQRVQRWIFTHLTKRKIFATPFRQQQANFNFTFPCCSKMNWYQNDTISIFGWTYWRPKNSVMETLSKKNHLHIYKTWKTQPIWLKRIRFFFDFICPVCSKKSRDFAPGDCKGVPEIFGLHHSTSERRCIEKCKKKGGKLDEIYSTKNLVVIWWWLFLKR